MNTYGRAGSGVRDSAKNALLAEHAAMARRIALRIARRTPSWISQEDLISAAMVGLAEAADRYDATRTEPFVGFAEKRIRGAVLDELRRGDILPRRQRASARKVSQTFQKLEQKLGRTPEDEEVAAALGVTVETYRDELETLSDVSFVELPQTETEEGGFAVDAEHSSSPSLAVEKKQLAALVRSGLEKLERRDAIILSLYYVEELTYAEIGKVLSVSESRVCQLHSRALLRLRTLIVPAGEMPAEEPKKKRAKK